MPDITMCTGEGCPIKGTCYRFTATPSDRRQSWFTEPPVDLDDMSCNDYWEMRDIPRTRRIR